MAKIYAYRKLISPLTTVHAALPDDSTELATLPDGTTYVAIPDTAVLPAQPQGITLTIVTPDAPLREALKAASPHCRVIAEQMQEKIRALYSPEDEMYFARIGVGASLGMYQFELGEESAMTVYGEHVEAVRQWGRAARAKLGL